MAILFHTEEGVSFLPKTERLPKKRLKDWLQVVANQHGAKKIKQLNLVFMTDDQLLEVNRQYLDHDYYTDIITFDHSDQPSKIIEGDLYISLDRVKENAGHHGVSVSEECYRVMVHGLLHLLGFEDKNPEAAAIMRQKEEEMLKLLSQMNPDSVQNRG